MTVTSADLSMWAAHRRAVVFTVARRVPGVDPELATSRGLEVLCVELLKQGGVSDAVAFWSAASVEVALEMAREEPPSADQAPHAAAVTAPVRRALDFEVLATAMERLPAADQQLLWDHHVGSRPVAAIADEIGVQPYAAKCRLRRAENRLASSFAETHTDTADSVECESTRASLHDFVRNRLLPRRRQKVEDHMVQCPGCTRAYVDVRESYWMLRAAAPVLLLGAATTAKTSTAVAAAGAGMSGVGLGGGFTTLSTRVALTVRSALTDPVGLTATVVGGLFITTAVTTGVAGGAGANPTFLEPGIVSVSTQDDTRAAGRIDLPPSRAEDPASLPEPARSVPAGPVAGDHVPPGLATKQGLPFGLAKKDGTPPGLAKNDGGPPGQADQTDSPTKPVTPGPATPGDGGGTRTPPGLAKQDKVPPGQARKDEAPPGQAYDEAPPGRSGSAPGRTASDGVGARSAPGHSDTEQHGTETGDVRWHRQGPPDHSRSRRTSTS